MIVPIIMGSKADLEFAKKIGAELEKFGLKSQYRVASAHKATEFALEIVRKYDSEEDKVVYIAVAGRSNALCGVIDANTNNPVITCPPYSDKFGGADIFSSIRMPSGVAPLIIAEPKNAALAAAKIFALSDEIVKQKVAEYKSGFTEAIKRDDSEINS